MLKRHLLLRYSVLCSVILLLIVALAGERTPAIGQTAPNTEPNLLVNGNFDELPFVGPLYPNHFVAGGWSRWWIHLTVLPEYDDVAKPGGVREDIYVDGGHAQVYFKWGPTYNAGIFQVVSGLTPCRPYELTMYGRTHSVPGASPGSRIGLNPYGTVLTTDGAVADSTPLNRSVWSREQTTLFTWEQLSVTAEPRGDSLTAILAAAPRPGTANVIYYYDTFWDAGALRAVAYAGERMPEPYLATDGLIYDVAATVNGGDVTIDWKLTGPATTQILYTLHTPAVISDTPPLTHTVYFPTMPNFPLKYDQALPVDYDAAPTSRTSTVTGVLPGQTVDYIVLARRLVGDTCVTEYAGPFKLEVLP